MTNTAAVTGTATTPYTSGSSGRVISSDFETFLKMLTTQIENQDPLNPVEASDYAVQLATFSGVEQQVLTNQWLQSLSGQMNISGMAQMGAWVGQEVRAAMPAWFDGSPVTIAPNPAAVADEVDLVVTDSAGTEIQRIPLPVSSDPVEWAGVTSDGVPLPTGLYSFTVESRAGDEVILSEQAEIYATVREVRAENGSLVLLMPGDVQVDSSAVTALRNAA